VTSRAAAPTIGEVFERFTDRARQVVVLAQDESRAFGHDYIGTEHLLLGLLREEEGVAAHALESLGVELQEARAQVEAIVGPGDEAPAGQIPFTPEAKKALELSLREALGLGHNHIGTEHVLLGVVRIEDSVAAQVLAACGLALDRVRDEVLRSLGGAGPRKYAGIRPAPRPPHWEYRVERVASAGELAAESLDELGADAWELVSVTPEETGLVLVFKRRRRRGSD
jgi:ATP-dependent Clp protease ATP-binding subunit ClpA